MSFNNAYQEGYDHGLEDAQNGIGKRYTHFPKGKAFVFGSDVYDSYCRGYDQGYSDGKAKKAGVYRDGSLTKKGGMYHVMGRRQKRNGILSVAYEQQWRGSTKQ